VTEGRTSPPGNHGFLAVCALALMTVLLLSARGWSLRSTLPKDPGAARIAVEHESPITLEIRRSRGKDRSMVEVSTDAVSGARISVPAVWRQREVRGGLLSSVVSEPASLGFTRWTLPGKVTLSFWADDAAVLTVHNPSGSPLLLIGKDADLHALTTEEASFLVEAGGRKEW
jgi:hypothetical protein